MVVSGTVHKYGNNIDTDVIIPARYLATSDMRDLAKYCMIDLDDTFVEKVKTGDVLVAGTNFGCGSSREHAPAVIQKSGISAVIAESFARIFYRNSINIGLPILECAEASRCISDGDSVQIDFESGIITNYTKGEHYQAEPFPPFIQNIIDAGGLMPSLTKAEYS